MKTIAIIGALEEEINSIKSEMEIISAKNIVGLDFIMGKMFGNSVVLVRSGVGKVNAAVCSQILIDMYAVDYIINIGFARTLSGELVNGDIVISDDAFYYDFDTVSLGVPKGEIYRMDESFFKADSELIEMASKAASETGKNFVVGRIASGDKFISDISERNEIKNEFKAVCVEMESAAIAHTCYLNKIPFVIVCLIFDDSFEINSNSGNIEGFSLTDVNFAAQIVKGVVNSIE